MIAALPTLPAGAQEPPAAAEEAPASEEMRPALIEAPGPYTDFAVAALAGPIRDDVLALQAATGALGDSLAAYCTAPAPETRAPLDEAFAAVAVAWAHVTPLQIEPLRTVARRERFFFWPDPRGITLRQIQPLIAARDPAATTQATLEQKSAALQGFGALEYLLYGTGAETILAGGEEGAFRCAYGIAIADNLAVIAEGLVADTAPDALYATLLAAPGPANALFRADGESTVDLVMSGATSVELARDQILMPTLGETAAEARPRLAPLWRSNLTLTFLAALLEMPADLFDRADLSPLLPEEAAGLPAAIRAAADDAAARALAIPMTAGFEAAATDPAGREALLAIATDAANLKALIGTDLPAALGIDLGFNALDGD